MNGIVWIDMHIRDERVLEWLSGRAAAGEVVITQQEIADQFRCHRHTARAILRRLVGAGYLECKQRARKLGYVYRIPNG